MNTLIITGITILLAILIFFLVLINNTLYTYFFEELEYKTYKWLEKNYKKFHLVSEFKTSDDYPCHKLQYDNTTVYLYINSKTCAVFIDDKVVCSGFWRRKSTQLYGQICKHFNLIQYYGIL